jgi:hypothetical protein
MKMYDAGSQAPLDAAETNRDVKPDLLREFERSDNTNLSCSPKFALDVLESGDVFSQKGCAQSLALTSGESLILRENGKLLLFSETGQRLEVESVRVPPIDIMPSITEIRYAGGVTALNSGGRTIIQYPNGTEVHIDREGFASVRRDGKVHSIGSEPDTFRGFK